MVTEFLINDLPKFRYDKLKNTAALVSLYLGYSFVGAGGGGGGGEDPGCLQTRTRQEDRNLLPAATVLHGILTSQKNKWVFSPKQDTYPCSKNESGS